MVPDRLYLPDGGGTWGGVVQTSPAALCVTSTCLKEVALLSQVDDDNNNILGWQDSFPTCQTFHRHHSSSLPCKRGCYQAHGTVRELGLQPQDWPTFPSTGAGQPALNTPAQGVDLHNHLWGGGETYQDAHFTDGEAEALATHHAPQLQSVEMGFEP